MKNTQLNQIERPKSKIKNLRFLLTLIGGAAFLTTATQANLVANGSFELPAFAADGSYGVAPTSWTSTGSDVNRGGGLFSPFVAPAPEDGNQYALVGTGGNNLQQTFHVSSGGDYLLNWFDNALLTGSSTPQQTEYNVVIYDDVNAVVASTTAGPYSGGAWNARSLPATLAIGDYRLYFSNAGTEPFSFYFALDNVSIDAAPATNPPTDAPDSGSTAGMLGVAASALLFIRHPSLAKKGFKASITTKS